MKDRIVKLMEKENLTPGQFSEIVGIQRSAVSHLVTGRNKPSLEVTQKILNTFRTINPDWLILGVGPMYRVEKQAYQPSLFEQNYENNDLKADTDTFHVNKNTQQKNLKEIEKTENNDISSVFQSNITQHSKIVTKIIVYYSDSTFEEFNK